MMRTFCRTSLLACLFLAPLSACTGGTGSSSSSSSSSSTGGASGGASSGGSSAGASSGGGGSSHAQSHGTSQPHASSTSRPNASSNTSGGTSDATSMPDSGPVPYMGAQETGVVCQSAVCDPSSTNLCCMPLGGAPTCEASMCSGFGLSLACDGPEDCRNDDVCCAETLGTSCKPAADCMDPMAIVPPVRVCGRDADCDVGQGCCTLTGLATQFLAGADFGTCQVGCGGGNTSSSSGGTASSSLAPSSSSVAPSSGVDSSSAQDSSSASAVDSSSAAGASSTGASSAGDSSSMQSSS